MQLRITPTRPISEVQREFNVAFPYLKLEFFRHKDRQSTKPVPGKNVVHKSRIGDFQTVITDGAIDIEDQMKVRDLENIFRNEFGLEAQVFRQSGNLWLQTTMTDDWTLQKQNEHGMELSISVKDSTPGNADNDMLMLD